MKDFLEATTEVARRLRLLDGRGHLKPLTSLDVVNFISALETRCGKTIPAAKIDGGTFKNLDSVAQMLARL